MGFPMSSPFSIRYFSSRFIEEPLKNPLTFFAKNWYNKKKGRIKV